MGKLTRAAARLHAQALDLVHAGHDLTEEEKEFILDNYQEAETTTHTLDGAFFTPSALAQDFSHHVYGTTLLDLGAGIGRLSYHCVDRWIRDYQGQPPREIVCVEKNPEYVAVGKRVLPEARWICADILDLPKIAAEEGWELFDVAISNPPFGRVRRTGSSPTYTGPLFEFHTLSIAQTLARRGAFILPQLSTPYRYSGARDSTHHKTADYQKFEDETGIVLGFGIGVDTTQEQYAWRGVKPVTEIVVADFQHPEEHAIAEDEEPSKPVKKKAKKLKARKKKAKKKNKTRAAVLAGADLPLFEETI
ncbi:methyltransferase [Streptomyces sp. CS014]|uniref:methyltransferase n=1 Tax=Streptomyces sp. CS014 TaxID=2162707 RepID=UPI000D50DD65|nr:methyltransferase [Streptomyces sp. CS014]PVD04507.1 methyltransferase [Streptomyces sp. CS014]